MRNFFNIDNAFFRFLSRIADLMILNILFILCSLPILTMGASLCALFYVLLKMRENEEGYIARSFFRAFKENFKKGTVIWLIMLLLGLIFRLDLGVLRQKTGFLAGALKVLVSLLVILWGSAFVYVFPLQGRFENTIQNTMRNALFMAAANGKQTIAMLVMVAAPVILTVKSITTMWYAILFWLMIGFAAVAWFQTHYLRMIFRPYIPEPSSEEPSEGLSEPPSEELSSASLGESSGASARDLLEASLEALPEAPSEATGPRKNKQ